MSAFKERQPAERLLGVEGEAARVGVVLHGLLDGREVVDDHRALELVRGHNGKGRAELADAVGVRNAFGVRIPDGHEGAQVS